MTAKPSDRIADLARAFANEVMQVVRESLVETLSSVNYEAASNGARKTTNGATKAVKFSHRAKGAKRSAEEIEALEGKFVKFVKAHPALRIEQIGKQLSLSTKELQLPIRKLIADGVIRTKGQKRATTYTVK